MARVLRLVLLAGVLAAAARLALAVPAAALSPARESAVAALMTEVRDRDHSGDPDADYRAVHEAWARAVDLRPVDADTTRLSDGDPRQRAKAFVDSACDRSSWLSPPRDQPAPGDLVRYRTSGATGRWRVGMFVSPVFVVIYDAARGELARVPRQEVTGDDGQEAKRLPDIEPAGVVACRFNAALLPGGVDDLSPPIGRVALVDPLDTQAHMEWAFSHPRDPHTGAVHTVVDVAGSIGAIASAALAGLLDLTGGAVHGLIEHLPVVGPLLAGAWALLGVSFDGRLLHRVLTTVLICGVLVLAFGPLGLAAAAAVAAGSALGVPILGRIGALAWAAASFLTSTLTGIDDSPTVSLACVLFAIAADAFVWAKPAVLAGRLVALDTRTGPLVAGMRAVLGGLSTIGDLVMLRPRGVAHVTSSIGALRDALADRIAVVRGTQAVAEVAPPAIFDGVTVARVAISTGSDALTWFAWRPSSVLSDVAAHLGDAGTFVAGRLAGEHPWPEALSRVEEWLAAAEPARRARVMEIAVQAGQLSELSHLHSGARVVGTMASGQPVHPVGGPGRDTMHPSRAAAEAVAVRRLAVD